MSVNEKMTAIADAIRAKTGGMGTLTLDQMPAAITSITSAPNLQSKSVIYTENGSATITPDAGYDGLSSVDVEVNVSGGGGGVETVTLNVKAGGPSAGWEYSIFATGIDGAFEITGFGTYEVVKNSMFFVDGAVTYITNLTELFIDFSGKRVYEVTGDARIDLG